MKTHQIGTFFIGIPAAIIIALTHKEFYNGYYRGFDFVLITLLALNIFLLNKKYGLTTKRVIVGNLVTALLCILTTGYLYADGDWDYKDYRLKLFGITLPNSIISLFDSISFYAFCILILVQILILYLIIRENKRKKVCVA